MSNDNEDGRENISVHEAIELLSLEGRGQKCHPSVMSEEKYDWALNHLTPSQARTFKKSCAKNQKHLRL